MTTTSLTASINATASPWTLVSAYLEHTSPFVSPFAVNELRAAGLLDVVTGLVGTPPERKAQAYARLQARGLVYGEEQIDHIAHVQTQIQQLQQELSTVAPTELGRISVLAGQLQKLVATAHEYFR
jgi:hypothetical protein